MQGCWSFPNRRAPRLEVLRGRLKEAMIVAGSASLEVAEQRAERSSTHEVPSARAKHTRDASVEARSATGANQSGVLHARSAVQRARPSARTEGATTMAIGIIFDAKDLTEEQYDQVRNET